MSSENFSKNKCDICSKEFLFKYELLLHVDIHDEGKSEKSGFNCSVCDKTFSRKEYLKNHLSIHTEGMNWYFYIYFDFTCLWILIM